MCLLTNSAKLKTELTIIDQFQLYQLQISKYFQGKLIQVRILYNRVGCYASYFSFNYDRVTPAKR